MNNEKINEKIVDNCVSLEVLKQDSGLLPKPHPNWKTFTPVVGDVAYVKNVKYIFDGYDWKVSV